MGKKREVCFKEPLKITKDKSKRDKYFTIYTIYTSPQILSQKVHQSVPSETDLLNFNIVNSSLHVFQNI